ncbi:MAG: hypothetical protein HWN81_09770 [Candidatus Lokiarchaeota archaeon]|nr:hypothetical protein [Candidatus Lokiarchaeota archaeon]
MHKNITKFIFKKSKQKTILISFIFLLILLFNATFFNQLLQSDTNINDNDEILENINHSLESANGGSILFEGIESPLNINDTGNLNEFNQEITVSNQEELNLTYYLDDDHKWEVNKIETSINNIQDTRDWVNNSDFKPVIIYKEDCNPANTTEPNYSQSQNMGDTKHLIEKPGALAIRAHFVNLSFEEDVDYITIYDEYGGIQYMDSGNKTDFFSPWILGDTLDISYDSNNIVQEYGYYIDYFEYVDDTSNYYINEDTWGFNINANYPFYGTGENENNPAMYVGMAFTYWDWTTRNVKVAYDENEFIEIYQNITIPRGRVVDASINFDYYLQYGIMSNDFFIYMKINNQRIYSRGFGDIKYGGGLNNWLSTGEINLDLWTNSSTIFQDPVNDQKINISVGIMNGPLSVYYSGFEDRFQEIVWFDNISLTLTTIANSTQEDIDLKIKQKNDNYFFNDKDWGKATLNLTGQWTDNPVILTVNTTSPSLSFELNTSLFGYHNTTSKINQQNQEGVSYKILNNGTIIWEFLHNLYMPSQYENFEFLIHKPVNWKILSVFDPTLQSRTFEGGQNGDNFIKINTTEAIFPGWWYFKATSPNYLNSSNTKLIKQGQWVENANFSTGESTQISTQLNYNGMTPKDIGEINLTIYHPNGTIFFTESKTPMDGNVTFSQITFSSFNTIGGFYEYSLFWSNGTALGGLKSSFIVNHQSSITLLKPDDAKSSLRTEGFVGDLIPVRILLKDSENNLSISNAVVFYNWTDGKRYLNESALGIYETVLDTADLLTRGLHNIVINSLKLGFFTSSLTLEINLGEETNLQVLDSDYNIELHANSTIRFKFTDFDEDPIDSAFVNISINNPSLYTITNPENGIYNIEFSTLYINEIGIYQLSINFSAVAYEPQYYIYQFQIIQQSVNLSAYINSHQINENALVEATFDEELNISARAISNIDQEYLSSGAITYISEDYEKNIPEHLDFWYNASIICSQDNFSLGINLVYLKFEHANYRTATFAFQILVNQLEINVEPVSFEDSINAEIGDTINIQIELLDPKTNASIENASVRYSWEYGLGTLNETIHGMYQAQVELPENLQGTYSFDLIITPDGSTYQTTQYSFVVVIGEPIVDEPRFPNYLLWIIIGVLISIVSALGILSLRTYVYIPRKRKKEAELLSKTQRFKDLKNIQAIVVVHKLSGIPIYSRSYSILEKHKKELFSGFIQAVTMIGEEFVEKEVINPESTDKEEGFGVEKMIELDFKQFYCLIADIEDLRVVFILKEKSSERLKSQVSHLILALNLKLSKELENWDGSLDDFEILVPEILNEYFELYYKDSFKLVGDVNLVRLKKERNLSKMELRVMNVIQSMSMDNQIANLNNIVELVHEENKNLIIEAIESLIKRKIIIPLYN